VQLPDRTGFRTNGESPCLESKVRYGRIWHRKVRDSVVVMMLVVLVAWHPGLF